MQKDHTHLWVQLCLRTNEWTIFPRAYLSEWVIGKMNLQWTLKADAWVIGLPTLLGHQDYGPFHDEKGKATGKAILASWLTGMGRGGQAKTCASPRIPSPVGTSMARKPRQARCAWGAPLQTWSLTTAPKKERSWFHANTRSVNHVIKITYENPRKERSLHYHKYFTSIL